MIVKEKNKCTPDSSFAIDHGRILNAVPALITYIDKDLTYRYANNAYHIWFGHNPESLPGRKLVDVMGEQAFNNLKPYLQQVLLGHTVNFQLELVYKTGKKYVDATYIPDLDEKGMVVGFFAHVNDITEKKETETELKKKTTQLQDYMENANIGLHWVNEYGIIEWANTAELEMLGYEPHEYIGKSIYDFHYNKQTINDIIEKLHNKETIDKVETQLICKDGSLKNVMISSSVLWEDNKFIHTRCFTVDITEKRKAE